MRSYSYKGSIRVPGNIVILECSDNGRFLASGGSGGTHILNTKAMNLVDVPRGAGNRGSTTALCFGRQLGFEVLYSGTSEGYVFVWRFHHEAWQERHSFRIQNPAEIRHIALDAGQNRFVVCTRNERVLSYTLNQNPNTGMWISTINFSKHLPNLSPNRLLLIPSTLPNILTQDVSVFGFHNNGHVYDLNGTTGEIKGKWCAGCHVCVLIVSPCSSHSVPFQFGRSSRYPQWDVVRGGSPPRANSSGSGFQGDSSDAEGSRSADESTPVSR
uniref:WD40 repeat-like protein n=1 Tax=Mycena chlorophos TaxID=658473 RepID=A0ABQ0KVF2_MYCCL|nr:WD40 repeat-like protein [Mycena chlorophos]